ncbi:hypothetical protein ACFLXL_01775 [Chloroflexota bacterium]
MLVRSLFALVVILLMVAGCLPVSPTPAPVPNMPPVASIDSLSATTITVGQTVSFMGNGTDVGGTVVAYSWRSDKDGILSTSASFSTSSLSVGNHYIYFKVQDNRGDWSSEIYRIVNVLSPGVIKPKVNSFQAVPPVIFAGESTTLTWNVSDAATVAITPDIGSVPLSGSRLVSPIMTTEYVLAATNEAGTITEILRMIVSQEPKKTVELYSIAVEEGYVNRNGLIGAETKAGITDGGVPMQAFFSFDISMIPAGSRIVSASLDLTSYYQIGNPFGLLGAFGVFNNQYGVLESRDYRLAFTLDALVLAYNNPVKPYDYEQLAQAIQKQVDARSSRFQICGQFEKFSYYQGRANYIEFNKGTAKLVVNYQ